MLIFIHFRLQSRLHKLLSRSWDLIAGALSCGAGRLNVANQNESYGPVPQCLPSAREPPLFAPLRETAVDEISWQDAVAKAQQQLAKGSRSRVERAEPPREEELCSTGKHDHDLMLDALVAEVNAGRLDACRDPVAPVKLIGGDMIDEVSLNLWQQRLVGI